MITRECKNPNCKMTFTSKTWAQKYCSRPCGNHKFKCVRVNGKDVLVRLEDKK